MSGHDPLVGLVESELGRGDETERDEQGLGDGRVLDLVRVGGGAEPNEVQTGRVGEGGDQLGHAVEFEPGGEHPGRLGALAGREYGDHSPSIVLVAGL